MFDIKMATIRLIGFFVLLQLLELAHGTCVLESEFGFILNCNFKKSSLFRVRNLGGVKAHFGLGFSLGDELGLAESLGNLEGNKRRSLSHYDNVIEANNVGVLPATKLTPNSNRIASKQLPTLTTTRLIPTSTRAPIIYKKHAPVAMMTEAKSLPLGVPPFKPLKLSDPITNSFQTLQHSAPTQNIVKKAAIYQDSNTHANHMTNSGQLANTQKMVNNMKYPAFQALPSSVSRVSTGQIIHVDTADKMSQQMSQMKNGLHADQLKAHSELSTVADSDLPEVDLKGHTVEELAAVANVSVTAIRKAIEMRRKQLLTQREQHQRLQPQQQQLNLKQQPQPLTTQGLNEQDFAEIQSHLDSLKETSRPGLDTFSKTTNSVTYFTMPKAPVTTTSAPVIVTPAEIVTKKTPAKKVQIGGESKVMNAPKEYYPGGYEKNFDDNFTTKVDLPPTTFNCGDQKHFPGLYSDTDLGCMVFHVCALTDDGLIMKSFLCPESTLFDQTILKCNWWFYVDCKSSKNLYDSNLPVSKSYQLMKALTFFSNFKKKSGNETIDIEALKNSVNAKGL